MAKPNPCREPGCERPKWSGKQRCYWHWLLAQPIEEQVRRAGHRLTLIGKEHRSRVPEAEWPPGERWCAGCQSFVPLFYARGSRCRACASQAAHASAIRQKYDLTEVDYQALLAWQGNRCYICRRSAHGRRLAVDHDHVSGKVRGLLCASQEFGCNKMVVGLIDGLQASGQDPLEVARRLVAYFEKTPYARLQDGEPSPVSQGPSKAERVRRSVLGSQA